MGVCVCNDDGNPAMSKMRQKKKIIIIVQLDRKEKSKGGTTGIGNRVNM